MHTILNAGSRCQKIQVEFALQALLDDFHMQKTQKANAETESQRMRFFGFPYQGRVVERQLLKRFFQRLVLVVINGKQAGKDHGFCFAVSWQRLGGLIRAKRDSVAHFYLTYGFQARDQVSHFACIKRRQRGFERATCAHFFHERLCSRCQHKNAVAFFHLTVHNANECNYTAVRVKIRVEDERFQRRIGVSGWCGNVVRNGFEQIMDAFARFAAC